MKISFDISTVILISSIITGIHIACMDGMVLEKPRIFVQNSMDVIFGHKLSEILQMPLFSCNICMSSVWSLIMFTYFNVEYYDVPALIFAVCGINALFGLVIKKLEI